MKYIVQLTMAALISISAASCQNAEVKNDAPESQAEAYQFVTLSPQHITGTVRLPGMLEPFEFVQIYPKVNGFVKNVFADRGSIVKKGQVLLTLEAPEIEENVSSAKLKYEEANANYVTSKDKYERLLRTSRIPGTVSAFDLNAARSKTLADSATVQAEWADYNARKDIYSYLTITAPFDGVITERNIHPGALVGPGSGSQPMLVLQQQSKLRLVVNIPEQYTAQVNSADIVHYQITALPGQDFTGKIARSSGSLNDSYRSETIELDVENTRNRLFKAGMYAEVIMPVNGDANAFIVPKSAVVTTTEHKYVVAVENGQARWIDVSEGTQSGDSTEVFGALHNGNLLVANATYQIKQGQHIDQKGL